MHKKLELGGTILYIARQPIFNKNLDVYGYELLFRSNSSSTSFGNANYTEATAIVLGGLFETGIEQIVEGKKAFVNFDYEFILSDTVELINPDTLVIEVLENVRPDSDIIQRLEYLKSKGYKVALDDFINDDETQEIIPCADIIKFDIMATPLDTIVADVETIKKAGKVLLAEKIETEDDFIQAKNLGFTLFQGYFFSKPAIVSKANETKTFKSQYAKIINELNSEEPSYQNIAEVIETDVNLAYRLMKVASGRSNEKTVDTIKKALVFMGLKEIERWMNILMLQDLSMHKPKELLRLSIIRSKFAEYIASNSDFKKRKSESFMMGLFSVIDAMLDQSMEEALSEIPLAEEIRTALIKGEGDFKPILDMIISYEQADWYKVSMIAEEIEISEEDLSDGYLDAIKWANQILKLF